MAKTATRTVLLTSQSNAAGATVRSAVLDCSALDGGIITYRMTNGATGPTVQCAAKLMFAHKQASPPAAAAEGTADTDWKMLSSIGGSTASNASTPLSFRFGPEIDGYLYVEFSGNTGQAVTVEAHASTHTYA